MNSLELKNKIAEKLTTSSEKIQDMVLSRYVDLEIERRSDLLFQGIEALNKLNKELTKLDKPDIEEYDSEKTKIVKYSKGRIEQIRKFKEQSKKFESSTEAAFDNNTLESYNKLDELLKQIKPESKPENKQG